MPICYRTFGQPKLGSIKVGSGKILLANDVIYLDADGREAEVIITNAPFLKQGQTEKDSSLKVWQGVEAKAAALAFNFTESK